MGKAHLKDVSSFHLSALWKKSSLHQTIYELSLSYVVFLCVYWFVFDTQRDVFHIPTSRTRTVKENKY